VRYTAIGIEPDTVNGEVFPHGGETFRHFFNAGHTRRVNIIKAGSEACAVIFAFKDVEKFEIGSGVFNRDDISIKSLDSPEDIVKVRLFISTGKRGLYVAEMTMDLSHVFDAGSCETEGLNGPFKIGIPFAPSQGTSFPQRGF